MNIRRIVPLALTLGLAFTFAACVSDAPADRGPDDTSTDGDGDGDGDPACTPGGLGCECSGGLCLGELECVENMCTEADGDGDGDGDPGDGDGDPGEPICGDGIVEGAEQCDDGGESAQCNENCQLAMCGDGVTNVAAGEECDDGNQDEADPCLSSCVWKDHCAVADILLASDGAAEDYYGDGVGISGDTIVIGAFGDDDQGERTGAAYVCERVGNEWAQTAKLTASDGAAQDLFGRVVAIDGTTILIGAAGSDGNDTSSGAAYVFEKQGGVWPANETIKLSASDGEAGDDFGYDLAISAQTIVIGAYNDDDDGSSSGSVYVFERQDDLWPASETHKLVASDAAFDDWFGRYVAISGDTIAVAAPGEDGLLFSDHRGAAYVFERQGDQWDEVIKLLASDAIAYQNFGIGGIAISGDVIVVGSQYDDPYGSDSGSAYVFERQNNARPANEL